MKKLIPVIIILFLSQNSFAQLDSLDLKIGQMIMIGMRGKAVTNQSAVVKAIKSNLVGGVLLFEFNLNPNQAEKNLAKLCCDLQEAATIPLLISIDQEGGKVNRLKEKYGFKEMPSAKSVGLRNEDEYTLSVGQTIAEALKKCGININFAPVLDVDNPNCPVLGKAQRCFSEDVEKISHIASIIMDAHRSLGIHTVAKHFPGHGNSRTDSHLGLADVSKYWNVSELIPYKNLIATKKMEAIMTAHIVNKQLDPSGLPATLSKKVVTDLLRNTMNFKGVVISDDMQMHAISSFYGFEESIKKAILAGVDILIFSNNIEYANQYTPANIHATIKKMVMKNEISMERIDESYDRIMQLKLGH